MHMHTYCTLMRACTHKSECIGCSLVPRPSPFMHRSQGKGGRPGNEATSDAFAFVHSAPPHVYRTSLHVMFLTPAYFSMRVCEGGTRLSMLCRHS